MIPVNRLSSSMRDVRFVDNLFPAGMVLSSLLSLRNRTWRLFRRPNSVGTVPVRLLPFR